MSTGGNFLDDLLAELKSTKGAKARVINLKTKRAISLDGAPTPEGEEGELEAWMTRMAEETQWRTQARVFRFKKQICDCCGGTNTSNEGLFLRQERGKITRYESRLYFTVLELDMYPLELLEFEEKVRFCYSCGTTELLCETVLNGRRQLPLPLTGEGK
jgi:hypothetical protein